MLHKPIFTNRLQRQVIPITPLFRFGAANASFTRNKEAANYSYDLHSLRQRASLPKRPFWLAERHQLPFLTLPTKKVAS
jgi:hypothetical protein